MARTGSSVLTSRRAAIGLMLFLLVAPANANPIFQYPAIAEPILNATFVADFAALTAHRFVGGVEVNSIQLIDFTSGLAPLDISGDLFGVTDALVGAADVDQGLLSTGQFTVPLAASFFPAIAGGTVGLLATLTDTFDGLFAIDFFSLLITTATGTQVAHLDANNGFGIGLGDGQLLPAPLPISIPVGATGTGFDEALTSVSFDPKMPEPGAGLLLVTGFGLLAYTKARIARHRRK